MIKSSSIFFIYTPQPEFRNAIRPVWDYLPKSYPHKFISVYLINSVYPHHLCVPASFVIRNASLSLVSSEVVAGVSVCFACQ